MAEMLRQGRSEQGDSAVSFTAVSLVEVRIFPRVLCVVVREHGGVGWGGEEERGYYTEALYTTNGGCMYEHVCIARL